MNATPRFGLPLLAPGQAQKELLHNEALQMLDIVTAAAVKELPRSSPPDNPALGSCFIVSANPAGEWVGHAHSIAAWTSGGWRFVAPRVGSTAFIETDSVMATFTGDDWQVGWVHCARIVISGQQVVGPQASAVPEPSGGTVIDAEARLAVGQILAALRDHGLIAM